MKSSSNNNPTTTLLFILSAAVVVVHGFTTTTTHGPHYKKCQHAPSFNKSCTQLSQQSQPNFGDWTNDDFLNSLSGGDNNQYTNNNEYPDENYSEPPPQPQFELSDDEITQWALNAAQFYNTDSSIEEAYGFKRNGPPRREEGSEVDGW